jgi:exopolyphosphatase/pppGpp-phosphohydrolase
VTGTNDYTRNLERIDEWLKARPSTTVAAVFDLGTRAARLLVGPKPLPNVAEWNEETFRTVGFVTALGEEPLIPGESPALEKLAEFVEASMAVLRANGVAEENVVGIGTEVFRSLSEESREDVVAWLERRSGLRLRIIDGETEARLSLLALQTTYRLNLDQEPGAGERLLLIDQGGGSTEVSAASGAIEHLESSSELGTVPLRRLFFANDASIPEQYERVLAYVGERIDGHYGRRPLTLAYGVGSAITAAFPGMNGWNLHNEVATVALLATTERERCDELASRYAGVGALRDDLERESDMDERVKREREVLILYGLPVYRMILEKLGLSALRVCGFPLRYGAFIAWHDSGLIA